MSNQPAEVDYSAKDAEVLIRYRGEWHSFDSRSDYERGSDDMLDEVIEFINDYPVWDIREAQWVEVMIDELKKAMRPQEDN